MKKMFLFLFAFLIVLSVGVPLLLNTSVEDAIHVIDHISFIIAAVCGIITTVIAILLYDKYGVEKTVLEKNLKIVLQVIDELKKNNCWANSDRCVIKINFWTTEVSHLNNLSNYLNAPLYFKTSYAEVYDRLFALGSDPLLPHTISEKIRKLQLNILPELKLDNMSYSVFVISSYCDVTKEREDSIIGKLNGKDMTLKEFVLDFMEVKKTIKQWLKAHNVDDCSLNF